MTFTMPCPLRNCDGEIEIEIISYSLGYPETRLEPAGLPEVEWILAIPCNECEMTEVGLRDLFEDQIQERALEEIENYIESSYDQYYDSDTYDDD